MAAGEAHGRGAREASASAIFEAPPSRSSPRAVTRALVITFISTLTTSASAPWNCSAHGGEVWIFPVGGRTDFQPHAKELPEYWRKRAFATWCIEIIVAVTCLQRRWCLVIIF